MAGTVKNRVQSISVALTPDFVEQCDQHAANQGISRSAYIKNAVELQMKRDELRQQLQQRTDLTGVELVDFLRVLNGEMPSAKRNSFKNEAEPDPMWSAGWNEAEEKSEPDPVYKYSSMYMRGWQARKDEMELGKKITLSEKDTEIFLNALEESPDPNPVQK